ncbi:polyketide cyclase [Enterococcus sp. UD-01]|jgi:hypothetical protein|uniref:polyketide cyclase n=1 Tax=Enterococcus sp. UD-01 TaxID=3373911 RepID=UPI0038347C4F
MNRTSTIEWTFNESSKTIWRVVTDNQEYAWRSDLERIESSSPQEFTEYYRGGGATEFHIIAKEETKFYAFELSNKLFTGKWEGRFVSLAEQQTTMIFTESLDFKNPLIYLLSFFMLNLKKMQTTYMKDLENKLKAKTK